MKSKRNPAGRKLQALSMGTAIATALVAIAVPTQAAALVKERTAAVRLDIPAQDLGGALATFARQSGQELLYSPELVAGRRSRSVSGRFSPRDGLRRLLAGSGIGFATSPGGAYLLSDAGMARSERSSPGAGEAVAAGAAAESEGAAQEIVVTGTNIRGVPNRTVPSISISRQDFARAGQSTAEDVAASIPQNFNTVRAGAIFASAGSRLTSSNNVAATAIDLRGLGAESTLTLFNGQRSAAALAGRAVDISLLPLAAVERVEIVTGGRSAVYGSDAVAGVVNFVTRRSFEGAESVLTIGGIGRAGTDTTASQIIGATRQWGGLVGVYEFSRTTPYDFADTPYLVNPSSSGARFSEFNLMPLSERHSAYLAGQVQLNDDVEIGADLLRTLKSVYTSRISRFPNAPRDSFSISDQKVGNFIGQATLSADMSSEWSANLRGAYSRYDYYLNGPSTNVRATSSSEALAIDDQRNDLSSASLVFQGPIHLPFGGTNRVAIGAEFRHEYYVSKEVRLFNGSSLSNTTFENNRNVYSVFGEFLSKIDLASLMAGAELDLSAAGRYDYYSDFGSTFNPQVGVALTFGQGLTFRGAYSRAFRAPSLSELSPLGAFYLISRVSDPATPTGISPLLVSGGPSNPNLGPERAETWSLGADLAPAFAPELRLSLSYYNVRYSGRIEFPARDPLTVLPVAQAYGDLIVRSPNLAFVNGLIAGAIPQNLTTTPFDPLTQNILSVFPGLVVFQNRLTNVAVERAEGLDLTGTYRRPIGAANFSAGMNLTYTIRRDRRVAPGGTFVDQVDDVGRPSSFRLRANVGLSSGPLDANVFFNHTAGYRSTLTTAGEAIRSYNTIDATLTMSPSGLVENPFLAGLSISVIGRNIFDRAPPPVLLGTTRTFNYDFTNADPFGRVIAVQIRKQW